MFFTSTYLYSIDEKGRLSVPSAYRDLLRSEKLPERLYLTMPLDTTRAIWAYPQDRFSQVFGSLADVPGDQDFFRQRMASTQTCAIDKQCRIIVPSFLRDHAGISRDVLILGVGKRFEIWDRANYKQYEQTRLLAAAPPPNLLR